MQTRLIPSGIVAAFLLRYCSTLATTLITDFGMNQQRCKGLQLTTSSLILWWLSFAPIIATHALEANSRAQSSGGNATWSFNPGVLEPLGVELDVSQATTAVYTPAQGGRYATLQTHIAQTSGLVFSLTGGKITRIESGLLELHDGPLLKTPHGKINLHLARLRVAPASSFAMLITDRSNAEWLSIDRPHYRLTPDRHRIVMNHFDVHIGKAAATALGNPALVGQVIGSIDLDLPIVREYGEPEQAQDAVPRQCDLRWPSAREPADVQMIVLDHDPALAGVPDSVVVTRCGIQTTSGEFVNCTPESTDGLVVIAADAAVQNLGTTTVPWRPMFSKAAAPYGNDQHPYLFWNLYRIDPDDTFHQIGVSGVKHAYFPDNFACNCPSELVAYPQCKETYAAGTNDVLNALGPRSEIIPATGQWARCGSIFDPDCEGHLDPHFPPKDNGFDLRLVVPEKELLSKFHPGAKYIFEYGYIVRDQKDPERAMAHRTVTPAKTVVSNGIRWSLAASDFALGPVINAWVNPDHPQAGSMNQRLATPNGHVRIAVRTQDIGNGLHRYRYVVFNEDFVVAKTEGNEPNLRMLSAEGISGFVLHLEGSSGVKFNAASKRTGTPDDWVRTDNEFSIAWAANHKNQLPWGNVREFHFEAGAPPHKGKVSISTTAPSAYVLDMLVPDTDKRDSE